MYRQRLFVDISEINPQTFQLLQKLLLVEKGSSCVINKGVSDVFVRLARVRMECLVEILRDAIDAMGENLFILACLDQFHSRIS